MNENDLPIPFRPELPAPYAGPLLPPPETDVPEGGAEPSPWRRPLLYAAAFLLLCVGFAALFFIFTDGLYAGGNAGAEVPGEKQIAAPREGDIPASADPAPAEETDGGREVPPRGNVVTVDETGGAAGLPELPGGWSLKELLSGGEARILIVNSHPAESSGAGRSVGETARRIADILNGHGLTAAVMENGTDEAQVIGAYSAMKAAAADRAAQDGRPALLIDVHDSDTELPVTLTVGTAFTGWWENLLAAAALAEMICAAELPDGSFPDCAVRLVPAAVGQDTGSLSLHLGIGGEAVSGADADALTDLCAGCVARLFEK